MKGIEQVLDQITTRLQTDFAAKASALNTEYGDAYTVVAPATASYYTELVDPLVPGFLFPAVIIQAQMDRPADYPLNHAGYEMDYDIMVDFIVAGADPHDLSRRLMRSVRAVREILLQPTSLAVGEVTGFTTDWRQPLVTRRESGDYLQDAATLITVHAWEVA